MTKYAGTNTLDLGQYKNLAIANRSRVSCINTIAVCDIFSVKE